MGLEKGALPGTNIHARWLKHFVQEENIEQRCGCLALTFIILITLSSSHMTIMTQALIFSLSQRVVKVFEVEENIVGVNRPK